MLKREKLKVSPDLAGPVIGKDWFDSLVQRKARTDASERLFKKLGNPRLGRKYGLFSRF